MSMSNNNTEKLGGPYTKTEQEQRREQVYQMHFEKGMSAVKIADELKVNRNTINDDIKYWNVQIGAKFGKEDIQLCTANQIEMMSAIKQRLLEDYKERDFETKLKIEKVVLDIENKIANIVTKMKPVESTSKSEITQETFAKIVKQLCHSNQIKTPSHADIGAIRKEILVTTEGNTSQVSAIEAMLFEQGLGFFESRTTLEDMMNHNHKSYDVLSFAVAKKIITNDEQNQIRKKRDDDI